LTAARKVRVVAALISDPSDPSRYLVQQRLPGKSRPLLWEFPGGKVEAGETYEDGLRRELREELGIEANIGPEAYGTRHDYPGQYTVELKFYHVVNFSGTLHNYTFEQICWAVPADLPTYDFLEGDAELISLLSQGKLPLLQSQA
jgi:8-oxo-dGTP diphosphatase